MGPMLYDIAAIQYIYGANMTTRTGDDVYTFGKTDLRAIWDAGGNDTFDASNQTSAAKIDLVAGHFSSFGSGKDNIAIAFNVVIENATGTAFNDTLTGNQVSNKLIGDNGNDILDSGGMSSRIAAGGSDDGQADDLQGGAGNDTYYLGAGDKVTEGVGQGTDTSTPWARSTWRAIPSSRTRRSRTSSYWPRATSMRPAMP